MFCGAAVAARSRQQVSAPCCAHTPTSLLPCCPAPTHAQFQPTQPTRPVAHTQVQERLQTHWLWRHAMRELREAGERAEAEAAAKAALAKLSGGGSQGGEDKGAGVPADGAAHAQAPPA